MLPYSRGLILDNANNYGIVKTEAVFGFGQRDSDLLNVTEPMEWLITPLNLENRSRQEPTETSRAYKPTIDPIEIEIEDRRPKKPKKKRRKVFKETKDDRKGKKVNKCVLKIMKKNQKKRKERKGNRVSNMKRKYMLPLILGLLAAKSVLIPIALKALAFMSAKGFLMGFFSTILASFLSIKGMFDHNHRSYSDRKDEKTQVEIIQVPSMPTKEDHYYDEHYKRADFIPVMT